ncbi:MAG: type II secretion system F family protein [Candidatus Diapherotrites archaeon]|nr:type II secretion system F family protein [Candidatus Diapherotrites archaeon]
MVYQRIAALLPKPIVEMFRKEIEYLDINISESKLIGFLFLYGLCLSLGIAFNLKVFFNIDFLLSFVCVFIMFFFGSYVWISNIAESKGKFSEKVLPDSLQLIASNIKAGLTTERAMLVSARPEFGPLGVELKKTSLKVMSGMPLDKAIASMSERIKSKTLDRTFWLISNGVRSGGQLADLLMQLADDLKEQMSIKEEINANISTYVLLIFITSSLGAPILFGMSSFIVEAMSAQLSDINMPKFSNVAMPQNLSVVRTVMTFGQSKTISPEFVFNFSIISLFAISLFSALTLGVINKGSEKSGLIYFPLILAISYILFFLVRSVLHHFFGGLLL